MNLSRTKTVLTALCLGNLELVFTAANFAFCWSVLGHTVAASVAAAVNLVVVHVLAALYVFEHFAEECRQDRADFKRRLILDRRVDVFRLGRDVFIGRR